MTSQTPASLPHMGVVRYGTVYLEGAAIICALGEDLMIYVPLLGVCQTVGADAQKEEARIQAEDALRDGLAVLPFRIAGPDGQPQTVDLPAISWTRLHTWLNGISQEDITDETMRAKLTAMKRELADLVYAYFGRPMLLPDLKKEQESHLSESQRRFYATQEELYNTNHRVDQLDSDVQNLRETVESLKVAVSFENRKGDFIDHIQQQQYRSIIGILGRLAEEKGEGGFDTVEGELKERFNFGYYKAIDPEDWEPLVRYCIQMHNRLSRNAKLPRVFEIALKTKTQRTMFGG